MMKGRHDPAFIEEQRLRRFRVRGPGPHLSRNAPRVDESAPLEGRPMTSGDHIDGFLGTHPGRVLLPANPIQPKHPKALEHDAAAALHMKQSQA